MKGLGFFLCLLFIGLFVEAWAADPSVPPVVPQARPGYEFSFPSDHGTHDRFRIEWWYFTGHLFSEDHRRFGFELTFFRRAIDQSMVGDNPSQWAIRQLYIAHFALSDMETSQFHYAEKLSRAGLGKAGARAGELDVWIDKWTAKAQSFSHDVFQLHAATDQFGIDLRLAKEKNLVIHGMEGISRKGALPTQTSHYYSFTRLNTVGMIHLNQRAYTVQGLSWMDHEFGSGELGKDQVGWDWFSLQLDSGLDIMVYLLRKTNGSPDSVSSGTVVFPDGRSVHLALQDINLEVRDSWTSRVSHARYPSQWILAIPRLALRVTITPVFLNQELITNRSTHITYWEGAVEVEGTVDASPVKGMGYVELTGYAAPLQKAY